MNSNGNPSKDIKDSKDAKAAKDANSPDPAANRAEEKQKTVPAPVKPKDKQTPAPQKMQNEKIVKEAKQNKDAEYWERIKLKNKWKNLIEKFVHLNPDEEELKAYKKNRKELTPYNFNQKLVALCRQLEGRILEVQQRQDEFEKEEESPKANRSPAPKGKKNERGQKTEAIRARLEKKKQQKLREEEQRKVELIAERKAKQERDQQRKLQREQEKEQKKILQAEQQKEKELALKVQQAEQQKEKELALKVQQAEQQKEKELPLKVLQVQQQKEGPGGEIVEEKKPAIPAYQWLQAGVNAIYAMSEIKLVVENDITYYALLYRISRCAVLLTEGGKNVDDAHSQLKIIEVDSFRQHILHRGMLNLDRNTVYESMPAFIALLKNEIPKLRKRNVSICPLNPQYKNQLNKIKCSYPQDQQPPSLSELPMFHALHEAGRQPLPEDEKTVRSIILNELIPIIKKISVELKKLNQLVPKIKSNQTPIDNQKKLAKDALSALFIICGELWDGYLSKKGIQQANIVGDINLKNYYMLLNSCRLLRNRAAHDLEFDDHKPYLQKCVELIEQLQLETLADNQIKERLVGLKQDDEIILGQQEGVFRYLGPKEGEVPSAAELSEDEEIEDGPVKFPGVIENEIEGMPNLENRVSENKSVEAKVHMEAHEAVPMKIKSSYVNGISLPPQMDLCVRLLSSINHNSQFVNIDGDENFYTLMNRFIRCISYLSSVVNNLDDSNRSIKKADLNCLYHYLLDKSILQVNRKSIKESLPEFVLFLKDAILSLPHRDDDFYILSSDAVKRLNQISCKTSNPSPPFVSGLSFFKILRENYQASLENKENKSDDIIIKNIFPIIKKLMQVIKDNNEGDRQVSLAKEAIYFLSLICGELWTHRDKNPNIGSIDKSAYHALLEYCCELKNGLSKNSTLRLNKSKSGIFKKLISKYENCIGQMQHGQLNVQNPQKPLFKLNPAAAKFKPEAKENNLNEFKGAIAQHGMFANVRKNNSKMFVPMLAQGSQPLQQQVLLQNGQLVMQQPQYVQSAQPSLQQQVLLQNGQLLMEQSQYAQSAQLLLQQQVLLQNEQLLMQQPQYAQSVQPSLQQQVLLQNGQLVMQQPQYAQGAQPLPQQSVHLQNGPQFFQPASASQPQVFVVYSLLYK